MTILRLSRSVVPRLLPIGLDAVKIKIRRTPVEKEIDSVNLTTLTAGMVIDVSANFGSWLVAEGYAVPEMRRDERAYSSFEESRPTSNDSPVRNRRRRKNDR